MAKLLALGLLVQLCISGSLALSSFDVTRFFSLSANSTCGEGQTVSDDCMLGDHNESFALDADLDTWWQSETGATPVELLFNLENAALLLYLERIQLRLIDALPTALTVETRPLSSSQFILHTVYVPDGSCDPPVPSCADLNAIVDEIEGLILLNIPLNVNEPVGAVRVVAMGFEQFISPGSQYYSISEAQLFGGVAPGHYIRSLHYIQASGADGVIVDSGERVPIGINQTIFPGSRGHAVLDYSQGDPATVQFVFPYIPKPGQYRLLLRYSSPSISRRPTSMIMQNGLSASARISLSLSCGENICLEPFVQSPNIDEAAVFELQEGPLTVQIRIESLSVLIDALIAVPEEFFNANIPEGERFDQECSVTNGAFSTDFCLCGAVQLSLNCYQATYSCDCGTPGSVADTDCQTYGGQCTCSEPAPGFGSFIGRQCNQCPFYNYQTPSGCTGCECPDPLDMCDLASGQCSSCPPLVEGTSCESCIENSFGDPSIGCQPCSCDLIGSESCDPSSGDCLCRPGTAEPFCDSCVEGSFNFSSAGCEQCDCDSTGSSGPGCDINGQCDCKPGVDGLKCSQCLSGFFAFSSSGCSQCNCSGRSTDCSQSNNSVTPTEMCACPPPYTGTSCEACLTGHYLSSATGDCEACVCNGRADSCEQGTGVCLECADNTTGPSCSVCLEGFYDSDPSSDLSCVQCPCNINTTINSSCVPDDLGQPVCNCLPGHMSPLCLSCDEGFFGDPPRFRCSSCDCNGNIDPGTPGSCDPDTGLCLLCINNSTGEQCQLCEAGYYGDATVQGCQACSCSADGAVDTDCDRSSGQCVCLPGVTGQACNQCIAGYWNFTSGVGCEECGCSLGSTSPVCDVLTGECPCSPGVTGDACSTCLNGYFNYTAQGCSDCMCGLGAVTSSCDSTGVCNCASGVTGDKCDTCLSFHTNLTSEGCQPCGECEQLLRDQLQEADRVLSDSEQGLALFEGLYEADRQGSEAVSSLLSELEGGVVGVADTLDDIERRLALLESGSSGTEIRVQNILDNIDAAWMRVRELQPYAETVHEHIQNVYNAMQEVVLEIGAINIDLQPLTGLLETTATNADSLSMYISNVSNSHNENFTDELSQVRALLTEATRIRDNFAVYLELANIQQTQINQVEMKFVNVSQLVASISGDVSLHEALLAEATGAHNMALDELQQLMNSMAFVAGIIANAESELENSDSLVNNIQITLMGIRNHVQEFEMWLGSDDGNVDFSFSGSGMGSGSGTPPVMYPPGTVPTTVGMGVLILEDAVQSLSMSVTECQVVLEQASDRVTSLRLEAAEINNILGPSLAAGNSAVGAIIDYMETIRLIQEALNITAETQTTLQQVQGSLDSVDTESIQSQVAGLLAAAQDHWTQAQALTGQVGNLSMAVAGAREDGERCTNETRSLSQQAMALRNRVNGLSTAVQFFLSGLSPALRVVDETLYQANVTRQSIASAVAQLLLNVTESHGLLSQIQEEEDMASQLLLEANSTVQETVAQLAASNEIVANIRTQAQSNEELLTSIQNSVDDIARQLALATQAAAQIDIALSFNGDTRHVYQSPPAANTTSISLAFRPSQVDYGTLLYSSSSSSNTGPDEGGVALRLFNGSLQFSSNGESLVGTDEGLLRENQWYQVYASRELDSVYLSVAPLQGGSPTYSFSSSSPPARTVTDDVIVLGGGESDSGLVLPNTDGYTGCIDRVIVNSAQLPLLLPNERSTDIAICGPRPPADFPRVFESGSWFYGAGSYLSFSSPPLDLQDGSTGLSISFRTHSPSGTLLYLTSTDLVEYLTVFLYSGQVVLEYSQTGLDSSRLQTTSRYDDGLWYQVSVDVTQALVALTVNGTAIGAVSTTVMPGAFNNSNNLLIGGLSPEIENIVGTGRPSLPACVREVSINGQQVVMADNVGSNRVSIGGCPSQVSPGVRCMGEGYAGFPLTESTVEDLGIEFRTNQLAASLLEIQPWLSVSVYHTRLRVDVGSSAFVTETSGLNDNRWHSLALSLTNSTLTVDENVYSLSIPNQFNTPNSLFVGGSLTSSSSFMSENFRGCVRNVQFNNRVLDFNTAQGLVGVALYGCRPPSITVPSPPPPPLLTPPPFTRPNVTMGLDGSPDSFVAIRLDPDSVLLAYSIELEFMTSSSNALLLYSQDVAAMFPDYLALELRGGRLYYSYNLGRGRAMIVSNMTYNDGLPHTVEIRRSSQAGQLTIDGGLELVTGQSPGLYTQLNIYSGLLFVGGLPSILNATLVMPGEQEPLSALACFLSVSVNGIFEDLSSPHAQSGAGECLTTYSNLATFSPDSYLEILDNYDAGVRFSIAMSFRTRSCDGLLAYSHSELFPDHIVLELFNKTLRFVFDNGPLEAVAEYTASSQLCDDQWHYVHVLKDGTRATLTVDEGTPVTVSSTHSSFRAVNLNDPLYIGGVPGSVRRRLTSRSGSFQGCIRDVYIAGDDGDLRGLLLAQAISGENVAFNTCNL